MTQSTVIHTVGHSNHPWETFRRLLADHGIEAVADCRSVPHSRRFPQFRKRELERSLADAGVRYVFLGRELGARRDEPECYVDGQARYDRVAALPAFQAGVQRVVDGAARMRIALMCAERDPLDCHRAVLVAPHVRTAGPRVVHIHADGSLESHEQLEQRMLRRAGTAADLFEDEPLARAYERLGTRMAYRRHDGRSDSTRGSK